MDVHSQRERPAFLLLPSVGTWLQARARRRDAEAPAAPAPAAAAAPLAADGRPAAAIAAGAAEDAAADAPERGARRRAFCLRPSVGTWLVPRVDEDSSWSELPAGKKGALEDPAWEADFESFLAEPESPSDAPPVVASSPEPLQDAAFPAPTRAPSGLFLLTPPPPPTNRCAVQTVSRAADVVVIEGLEDEKKPKAEPVNEEKPAKPPKRSLSTTEELIGTNRAPDDDEELLLGDDAAGPTEGLFVRRPAGDGVDSASESDVGEQRPVARPPPPPAQPTPRAAPAAPGADGGAPRAQEPEPKWEPLATESPQAPVPERPAQASPPVAKAPEVAAAAAEPEPPREGGPVGSQASKQAAAAAAEPGPAREGAPVAPQASKQAPFPSSSAAPPAPKAAWTDVDSQVAKRLDNFFGDRNTWERVSTECNSSGASPAQSSAARFRVRVPAPHPGLQYRRSKMLGDRYQRYVENGSMVTGQVEDGGTWLRLSHNVFLPMRIDGNQVLEPVPAGSSSVPAAAEPTRTNSVDQLSWIWGWCNGCRDGQVQVDADILVRGDAPRTAGPAELPPSFSSR